MPRLKIPKMDSEFSISEIVVAWKIVWKYPKIQNRDYRMDNSMT